MKTTIAWAAAIAAFLLVGGAITFGCDLIGLDPSPSSLFGAVAANLIFQAGFWAGIATHSRSFSVGVTRQDALFCRILISATAASLVLLGIMQIALPNFKGGAAEIVRQSADWIVLVGVGWFARSAYKRSAAAIGAENGD